MTSPDAINAPPTQRRIVKRTRGQGGGPITRLMSRSDLGETLKPFVFLDIINMDDSTFNEIGEMPLHPHSGIATVTVFTEGHMRYDDPAGGSGKIGYGGVEWMRAGGGVWHGKEMSPGKVERLQGFQLWLSLPKVANRKAASSKPKTWCARGRLTSLSANMRVARARCPRRRVSAICWSHCSPASHGPIRHPRAMELAGWPSRMVS